MRISQSFGAYNQRRYGRPWICKITSWPVGGKPEVQWGAYCGTDDGGEVEIDAAAGDIVRIGQKDHYGNKTSADWYLVGADGSLLRTDAAGARKAWEAKQADKAIEHPPMDLADIPDAELIAEIKRRNIIIN